MRELFHEWWPVAAVTLFTLFLVLQIPRKAIFPPVPEENTVEPFASFVTLKGDVYTAVSQNGDMSWQLRARTRLSGGESRTAFEFDESVPMPRSLPVGDAFSAPYRVPNPAPAEPPQLLPDSLARSGVEGLAKAAEAAARPRDAELLALPDSLKEKGKEQTP